MDPTRHGPTRCSNTAMPAPFNRRDVLRVGSLAISASVLPSMGLAGEAGGLSGGRAPRARSVIYLWMAGGVTHIDSFDPKPDAPEEIRGTLGDIATNAARRAVLRDAAPTWPQIADKLALVRSFSHDSNDHLLSQVYTLSGRKVTHERSSSASRTSARSSRTCTARATGCRATSPCRASRGPARRRTTCSSAAGWGASTPRSASAASRSSRTSPSARSSSIRPPLADEDLQPQIAAPAGRAAARPPAAAARSCGRRFDAGAAQARPAATCSRRPMRSTTARCGCLATPQVRRAFDLSRRAGRACARPTAARRSAGAACWPAGWSRRGPGS